MKETITALTVIFIWLITFALWSAFFYGMLWLFSYQDNFSWKISLGVMVVWILIVRLFKMAGRDI